MSETLTQAQVDALPEGAEIEALWIHHDSPARYIVRVSPKGLRWASLPAWPNMNAGWLHRGVGTRVVVRLVSRPAARGEGVGE